MPHQNDLPSIAVHHVALPALLILCLACPAADPAREEGAVGANGSIDLPAAEARFAGRESCASCHPEEAARWSGSHHDLAMQPATGETVLGDFADARFSYAGVTSTFFRRGDRFMVRTDDGDGEMGEWPIAYTFGFDPLQQYLVEVGGGRYQALTIAWDSRPAAGGGQRWFHLYSEEDAGRDSILHWSGPYLNWNYMCAECHSTDLRKRFDMEEGAYATSWSEIDVSCEACHGPGSRHVELMSGRPPDGAAAGSGFRVTLGRDGTADWAFDPGAATARRQGAPGNAALLPTCGRCHSRRTWIWEDYLHGGPLLDTHRVALLEENLYHADGQIQEEVYEYGSFLQSRMQRAGVTCVDCHDPHSARLRADGNDLCATCHRRERFDTPEHHFHETGGPGARCVDCHMIVRDYMVVDPRRDHSFRVPRPDLTEKIGTPNACTDCHADRPARWAAEELRRRFGPRRADGFHYGEALHAGRRSLTGAEVLLARVAGDAAGQPGIVRATALSLLPPFSGPASRATVEDALRDPDPLVRIGAVRALDGFPPEERLRRARPLLDDPVRGVRLEATRLMAEIPTAGVPREWQQALAAALEEYRRAQLFNADRAEGLLNLARVELRLDQPERAEATLERAIAMQPRFIPAYVNLADLYRSLGRDGEGESVLRRAIAVQPDSADAHHSLGLLLVRRRSYGEAIDALRRGAELAPDEPHYAYVHAVALAERDGAGAAVEALERAQRAHPIDREILSALSLYSEQRGDLEAAARWARMLVDEWPNDERWRELAARIEQRRRTGSR